MLWQRMKKRGRSTLWKSYEFERTRDTVEMSELTIPDMVPRNPERFWDSLSLSIGAIDKLTVVNFDAFAV